MTWLEPISVAKARAAIWNEPKILLMQFLVSFVLLLLGLVIPVVFLSWRRGGEISLGWPLAILVPTTLLLSALLVWSKRFPVVQHRVELGEDSYSIRGNITKSGPYSDLVGFAFISQGSDRVLILFDPQGSHLSAGIPSPGAEADIRNKLAATLNEIAPEDAPEPRMPQFG